MALKCLVEIDGIWCMEGRSIESKTGLRLNKRESKRKKQKTETLCKIQWTGSTGESREEEEMWEVVVTVALEARLQVQKWWADEMVQLQAE